MEEYRVTLKMTSALAGGVSSAMAERPWPQYLKDQEEREHTAEETAEEAEALVMRVGFRRVNGKLALSANQIRSMLQECTRALKQGQKGAMVCQQALRTNLWVEPTRIVLDKSEPDGVVKLPRTIRRPPFERSVVNEVEYVDPPVVLEFGLKVINEGRGTVLTEDWLKKLFEHGQLFVGLGAHRGLEEFGRFKLARFEKVDGAAAAKAAASA